MPNRTENELHKELHRIAKANDGVLTAEAVVAAARDSDSPLHDSFDWSDTTAAMKWRLHQARNLILKIRVVYPTRDEQKFTIREWSNLTTDRGPEGGYRETIRVLRDDDMRAQLLADAMAELDRIRERYRTLTELSEVFSAIKQVKDSMRPRKL